MVWQLLALMLLQVKGMRGVGGAVAAAAEGGGVLFRWHGEGEQLSSSGRARFEATRCDKSSIPILRAQEKRIGRSRRSGGAKLLGGLRGGDGEQRVWEDLEMEGR